MKCILSMSVFSHILRLQLGEDNLKGDYIDGLFYFVLLCTSSIHSRPFVPRQTWRLTGNRIICMERKSLLLSEDKLTSINNDVRPGKHRVSVGK